MFHQTKPPNFLEYANDVDCIDEEKQPLEDLFPTAGVVLQDVNLFMNKYKTEFTYRCIFS